jgi:hypothetical protein
MPDFHEISFLRSNALELRKIALVEPPTIAADLHRIARDWDARADELESSRRGPREASVYRGIESPARCRPAL